MVSWAWMGLPRSPAQNEVGPGTGHLPNLPGTGWGGTGWGNPSLRERKGQPRGHLGWMRQGGWVRTGLCLALSPFGSWGLPQLRGSLFPAPGSGAGCWVPMSGSGPSLLGGSAGSGLGDPGAVPVPCGFPLLSLVSSLDPGRLNQDPAVSTSRGCCEHQTGRKENGPRAETGVSMHFPFDRKPLNISITYVVSPKWSCLLTDEPRLQASLTLWSPLWRLSVLAPLLRCDQHGHQHPMGSHFCFALFHEDKLQRKQLVTVYRWFLWLLIFLSDRRLPRGWPWWHAGVSGPCASHQEYC